MSSNNQDNSLTNFLLGMIIGLLTGGILSLIYSPNSGEENRRKAKAWADETSHSVREKAEALRDEVENPYGKARQFIDEKRYSLEQRWNNWQAKREADKMSEAKEREAAQDWDDAEPAPEQPTSEAETPQHD